MTEQEAIKFLTGYLDSVVYKEKCVEAHKLAIKALKEIQQYRELGTVDEIIHAGAIGLVENVKLKKYEAIGTVEECRKAVEKQTAYDVDKVVERCEKPEGE